MARMWWKRRKTFAMLANKRQWAGEFYPPLTGPYEIEMEHLAGYYLVIETSDSASPNYIITE
jgi:hypothetical protein